MWWKTRNYLRDSRADLVIERASLREASRSTARLAAGATPMKNGCAGIQLRAVSYLISILERFE